MKNPPLDEVDIIKDTKIKTPLEIENDKINELLNSMTIEEKVGQLFIYQINDSKNVDDSVKKLLEKFKPGGIILFARNIVDNDQILKLNNNLQSNSKIPLFIGVDEEGGIVSRLGKNKNVDVTHLPPALTIGNKKNPILAYNSGKILGRELSALGFNMDMAPVADVNTNPKNPVIGNRTYSNDPFLAGEMVVNVVNGLKENNIIPVIKHFPGHGDTSNDSHLGTVISPHKRDRLDQIEFIPFKMGIENGVEIIMTAHINMPGITTIPLPATLNPDVITDILRNDMGFNGIIMTDALDMGAISQNYSSGEAAILGIKAGVDILLIPFNQEDAFTSILNSINNNVISIDRINDSVKRIIRVKLRNGLYDNKVSTENINDVKTDPNHQKLVDSIFE